MIDLIWENVDWDAVEKYTAPIAIFGLLLIVVLILALGKKSSFTTKETAFAAITLALSYALSFIKVVHLPKGGSLTPASILPILLFSYYFGWKKGLFIGLIYSVLQIMQSPQIYHPLQVLLDYPMAFGSIFIVGLFKPLGKKGFFLGVALYGLMRYFCHFLSGAIFFGIYAWEGWNIWIYSLVYNSYVLIDIAITLAVGILLMASKNFTSIMETFASNAKKNFHSK